MENVLKINKNSCGNLLVLLLFFLPLSACLRKVSDTPPQGSLWFICQ